MNGPWHCPTHPDELDYSAESRAAEEGDALALIEAHQRAPGASDWSEFEDDLSDAISDSIDMDWTGSVGAKAVVRWLDENCPRAAVPSFAWVIEAPGQNYLGAHTLGRSEFYWTTDHLKALRFYSREDASAVQAAVRELAPDLFAFAKTLGEAWPVQHGWIDHQSTPPLASSSPGIGAADEPEQKPHHTEGDGA